MSARQVRVETRSRHQSDLKRVMHSTARVRKWEKKWVQVGETSMQIFKWMPIKVDEQQQQAANHTIVVHKTQQPAPMREVLDTNKNILEESNDSKLEARTNLDDSKMLLANNNHELNSNGSQSDEQMNNDSHKTLNNNYTTMYQRQENANKRKLDELDLTSSSDGCGSSSCSDNEAGHESNSNSATDDIEKFKKRQKTVATINENDRNNSEIVDNAKIATTTPSPPPIPIYHSAADAAIAMESDQIGSDVLHRDDEMILEDTTSGNSGVTNNQNLSANTQEEICMDSNEDLTSVARLVTEQIVTRVSDCYMDI